MFQEGSKLFKVSVSTGKLQEWSCVVDGVNVVTTYGQVGGKLQTMSYEAEAKNVGRANATTAEEQAAVEVQANYRDQIDNKHYRETEEEATELAQSNREPRKIHKYKDRWNKMSDELGTVIKANGSRACVLAGQLYSKQGRPEDIKVDHLRELVEEMGIFANFDAEVYAHGISLQRIRSAWLKPVKTDKEIIKFAKDRAKKKGEPDRMESIVSLDSAVEYLGYNPNHDASKLKFYIFDIPDNTGKPYLERVEEMKVLEAKVKEQWYSEYIEFLYPFITSSHEVRVEMLKDVYGRGWEGLVHYELDGVYEFGKRSSNTCKDKPRLDAEALVIDVTKDKSGQGVLKMRCGEEFGFAEFSGKMKGTAAERAYDIQKENIGKWVNYQYEELSDLGVPTKPVVIGLRDCDMTGNPLD